MKQEVLFDEIYPLTIISDRYSGAYSDAQYLAFNLHSSQIPDDVGGGDMQEEDFWHISKTCEQYTIGKGSTPNEAYVDLLREIEKANPL